MGEKRHSFSIQNRCPSCVLLRCEREEEEEDTKELVVYAASSQVEGSKANRGKGGPAGTWKMT